RQRSLPRAAGHLVRALPCAADPRARPRRRVAADRSQVADCRGPPRLTMRVLQLWDNYAPGLFDQTLAICREEAIDAALVAMNWIDRGVEPPRGRHFVRTTRRAR